MTKVLVAMSGGVDSTVAAWLLMQRGHQVRGLYMQLWGGERVDRSCSTADQAAARAAAQHLGIDLDVLDWTEQFHQRVLQPHLDGMRRGVVGNPCLNCNRQFKIQGLLAHADQCGYQQVASGHYARVLTQGGRSFLARALDQRKDQSYVLHSIPGRDLGRYLFPLGELTKQQVRDLARQMGAPAAAQADSMDLCFDPAEMLGVTTPVPIVDTNGDQLGGFLASEKVTIGQRRGLGTLGPHKRYVIRVEPGQVVVGSAQDLLTSSTVVDPMLWVYDSMWDEPLQAQASAHGTPVVARAQQRDGGVELLWDSPVRRPQPGQEVVLYLDDRVVGGGVIR